MIHHEVTKKKKYEKIVTYVTVYFAPHNFLCINSHSKHEDDIDYDTEEFLDIEADNELNQSMQGWMANDAYRQ